MCFNHHQVNRAANHLSSTTTITRHQRKFELNTAAMATEISFAKSFLSLLDTKPAKISPDHVEDPRTYPGSTPVRPPPSFPLPSSTVPAPHFNRKIITANNPRSTPSPVSPRKNPSAAAPPSPPPRKSTPPPAPLPPPPPQPHHLHPRSPSSSAPRATPPSNSPSPISP